jgi:predicted ArsR family transcriptional regulator
VAEDRLPILKALGDNTRYAIYLEVVRSPSPRSTAEIAESLGLHPNTVRPHLERMRDAGLLEVVMDSRGQVGRPQHRYSVAPDAPSLGLEPPAFPLLARMLGALAVASGADPEDAAEIGRAQGRAAAAARQPASADCVPALLAELDSLGFDPAAVDDGDGATTVAFTHCPYRELAEAYPELVCHLHRGLVEGFVARRGGAEVTEFNTLAHRRPCQVSVVPG